MAVPQDRAEPRDVIASTSPTAPAALPLGRGAAPPFLRVGVVGRGSARLASLVAWVAVGLVLGVALVGAYVLGGGQ